jgi:hypothetical protein
MCSPGAFFIKIVMIARYGWAEMVQRTMLFTSADKLHMHPSLCSFVATPKLFFVLNLREEANCVAWASRKV